MVTAYREKLDRIRPAFLQPASERVETVVDKVLEARHKVKV
ncbi:MAG TPA: hypothetical protein VFK65_26035 [Candidatus Binatia bacterium]|jgi:hypothetical protein|nr:hypothetical protein [Candidatus Binatia bacterium]